MEVLVNLNGRFWPKAEVRLVRGIISATDPDRTVLYVPKLYGL